MFDPAPPGGGETSGDGRAEVLATLKRNVFGDRKVKCLQTASPRPGHEGGGVVKVHH
ncbi:hypothetical protein [Minwuia thermotolerans]|nr:hypothetical protein [Minwuia thermotolerans]